MPSQHDHSSLSQSDAPHSSSCPLTKMLRAPLVPSTISGKHDNANHDSAFKIPTSSSVTLSSKVPGFLLKLFLVEE